MGILKTIAGWLLGRRPAVLEGEQTVDGAKGPIRIDSDEYGVPYIHATSEDDAWFGLGYCHARDRGLQVEMLFRVGRGTVAALLGKDAIGLDRLARRIGFHRAASAQFAIADAETKAQMEAYARGINAGMQVGREPHEFALLRKRRSRDFTAVDVQAYLSVLAFALASNWDIELVRLHLLLHDGPEAVRKLEPAYRADLPVTAPSGDPSLCQAVDRLARDLADVRDLLGVGGGSNAWAVSAERSATGRPILANDPHLNPATPGAVYLARIAYP
ncbi:MAG: penicillin amidase, partial [Myxococcota bacterium]